LIGLPLSLPVGWKESPPIFCATTETVADLAIALIQQGTRFGPHRLKGLSESIIEPAEQPCSRKLPLPVPPIQHYHKPVWVWDVYVDHFIRLVQGNIRQRVQVKWALLHALDQVYQEVGPIDNRY
jgi:hypothetical protein